MPAPMGAGGPMSTKTRLESSSKNINPHFTYTIAYLGRAVWVGLNDVDVESTCSNGVADTNGFTYPDGSFVRHLIIPFNNDFHL